MKGRRKAARPKTLALVSTSESIDGRSTVKERPSLRQPRGQKASNAVPELPLRPLHQPPAADHPAALLRPEPAYATPFGAMVCGDAATVLAALAPDCVDLVVTSPPYALHFKKEYGNADKAAYVEWFRPFAVQVLRVLKPEGSFVLNIGGSYNPGVPTRSLYHFRLLLMLCDELGFHLAQECFWYNPAKLPSPAEWVNVRRIRIKDSVEYVWWLSKTPHPKADNRHVLEEYSDDMRRLLRRGYRAKKRPSGHTITHKFSHDRGGAIPSNVLERGNNESNSDYIKLCDEHGQKPHPARFPAALPEFYMKFLTRPGDLVVDPFAGSNTTGFVAERLQRRWLSFEIEPRYVDNSRLRFGLVPDGTACSRA
jgi:site-specific DNA-methyltransferase (cytosine-N4-specific)